jgi:hypothetical protein
MKLRTLGWAIAVLWAVGMTWAMARIAGTLDSLAARPEPHAVASAPVPAGPSEIAFSLRAPPSSPLRARRPSQRRPRRSKPPRRLPTSAPLTTTRKIVLDQMVAKGGVDDESSGRVPPGDSRRCVRRIAWR